MNADHLTTHGIARFGVFELDFHTRELRKRGTRIALREQPFQALARLVSYPGALVTREGLRSALWPDTFVGFDDVLDKAMVKIRRMPPRRNKEAWMHRLVVAASTAALFLSGSLAMRAQEAAGTAQVVHDPGAHVRAVDPIASHILARALALSPTVEQMASALDDSDVIVVIETRCGPQALRARVQVQASTPSHRYLRLSLRVPNAEKELVELLGHELHHCLEIASMPEVRDSPSLARAYTRIGRVVARDGYFETDAALATARQVAHEVAARRARRDCTSDGSPTRR